MARMSPKTLGKFGMPLISPYNNIHYTNHMPYAGGEAFGLVIGISRRNVDYPSQQSWDCYPPRSTNPTIHLPQLDVPTPNPVNWILPRPNVNYNGEWPWTTNPFYQHNTSMAPLTPIRNIVQLYQEQQWRTFHLKFSFNKVSKTPQRTYGVIQLQPRPNLMKSNCWISTL